MSLKTKIDQDLKAALLGGDKSKATTLRGLKSAILYAEVDKGQRETGLSGDEIVVVLSKEAKKRQESADLYAQGGDPNRQQAELAEKAIIDAYLPAQMDESALVRLIDEAIKATGATDPSQMGQVIGQVKQ